MSEIDTERPFPDWVWNADRHKWQYPNIQLPTSKFDSEWDEVNNKWISQCKVSENRSLRVFSVMKTEIKNDQSPYKAACSTTEYMIKSLTEETHGSTAIDDMVVSVENGEIKFPFITKHFAIIDLAPVALITYSEMPQESLETNNALYSIHPQAFSRSIHELFRLIIEWAYSYTEFENTEPMAKICHEILQIVQMPKDIRDELIGIRPQQVGKFIQGSTDALQDYNTDIEMPESFKLWVSDVYYDYRERSKGFPIGINQSYAHLTYPM